MALSSSEFGFMNDEQLLERMEKIAYGTISTITLGAEEYCKELNCAEKLMMIQGVIALICDISDAIVEERDKHGAANS